MESKPDSGIPEETTASSASTNNSVCSKLESLPASLNKAANLLGVNEINKFDYRSLNSIRKLAKTLGCNEYDLMKTFNNNNNTTK
jgi:hypothetical protein